MTCPMQTTARRHGAKMLRALAVVALTASLAGCYSQRFAEQTYPTDYRERHPISLKEGQRTVEILLSRNRGGLTPVQRADVLSFTWQWRNEASSGIIIDVPHSGLINRAANDSMHEVQSILISSGVPRNAVYVRKYRPLGDTLATIRLSYAKPIAQADPCGRWPHDLGPSFDRFYLENQPYWNLGCASQRNLAAIVDNPIDLVQPRGELPGNMARRSVAIEKYRKGDSPSGKYDGYDSGKISDLAK